MKFAEFSDIHGNVQFVNELPDQKDTILLIPGDIHEVKRFQEYKTIVQVLTNKFKAVVMVPGNHEYYKSNFHKTHRKLQNLIMNLITSISCKMISVSLLMGMSKY